jgi:hypothetical protein
MSLPIPNLDDKRFEQIVEDVKKLIPIYAPEWTDHNLHDPGIALIELFAWLTEMQVYSLNRIGEKHHLKYLKMLGIPPQPATPATVDVTFKGNHTLNKEHFDLNKGDKVIAEDVYAEENVVFELEENIKIFNINLKKIKVYSNYQEKDVTDFNEPNKNFFYPFGERPKAQDYFLLGFDSLTPPDEDLTISFYLYERDLPPLGRHDGEELVYDYNDGDKDSAYIPIKNGFEELPLFPSAKVKWRLYCKTDAVTKWEDISPYKDETIFFSKTGRVSFKIPQDVKPELKKMSEGDKELYWLKCEVLDGGWEIQPRIERILLNTYPAIQGETVEDEVFEKKNDGSDGMPNQFFEAKHKPIIFRSLKVTINNDDKWSETDNFDSSKPEDKHYKIDYKKGLVFFGNGIHGTIPPKDATIKIEYRYGSGQIGNIREGAINKIEDNTELTVTNNFPAFGSKKAETIKEAIIRARKEIRTSHSAVTLNDYEEIAKSTPGLRVARAKAITGKADNAVTVVVVPYGLIDNPKPSEGFINTVCHHVDRHRLISTAISIKGPKYISVSVSATIKRKAGFHYEGVRDRCIKDLNKFLSPIARKKGDTEWPLGRTVYKSEVYEVLENVKGVDGVFKVYLKATGEKGSWSYAKDGNVVIDKTALVYSGRHSIEVIDSEIPCKGGKYA